MNQTKSPKDQVSQKSPKTEKRATEVLTAQTQVMNHKSLKLRMNILILRKTYWCNNLRNSMLAGDHSQNNKSCEDLIVKEKPT
jgi:hypothetical protein